MKVIIVTLFFFLLSLISVQYLVGFKIIKENSLLDSNVYIDASFINGCKIENCINQYERRLNFKDHLNIILTTTMDIDYRQLYPKIDFKEFNGDKLILSSFCNGKHQFDCWKRLLKYGYFNEIQYYKFKPFVNIINSYESVCIFANSRMALHLQYIYDNIFENINVKIVMISPVLNPFSLVEFTDIKMPYDKNYKKYSGYLKDFTIKGTDKSIIYSNQIDERVNEKHLFDFINKNNNVISYIKKNTHGHDSKIPKQMVEKIESYCGFV